MTLLIGNSRVAVLSLSPSLSLSLSVSVCVSVQHVIRNGVSYSWHAGRQLKYSFFRTDVTIFLFLPTLLAFLTGSYILTVERKSFAVNSVSYSTHLHTVSKIRRGNLSTWCGFYFWNLQVLYSLTAHIGHWQLSGTVVDIPCFAAQQITMEAPSTQPFTDVTVN
jgi:hypothetical protein